jgi:photosystem II stability/assembly factor-like uncharacterized protein
LWLTLLGASALMSQSAGTSWGSIGLNGIPISAVAIDPRTPDTIYAGGGAVIGGEIAVFKTTDHGSSWHEITAGLPTTPPARGWNKVTVIAIDSMSPETIYVALESSYEIAEGYLFKSDDAGANWRPASRGLGQNRITSLAIDPHDPGRLYLTTYYEIFQSINGGETWVRTGPGWLGPPAVFSIVDFYFYPCLAVDPQQPSTVFAGMYGGGISKTTDHGGSWQAINVNLPSVSVIAIDPVDSNIIYAGTANFCGCQAAPPYAGFWKSLDGGATWQRSDSGLPSRVGGIFSIAIDPRNHRKIYLATDDDVYVSRDGAGHWSRVGAGLQVGIGIPPLIISQRHADTLLAGNRGVFEFALREPRLVNFSTLGRVGSGPDVLTAGFVVDGASAMPMVLRAIGPTLGEDGRRNRCDRRLRGERGVRERGAGLAEGVRPGARAGQSERRRDRPRASDGRHRRSPADHGAARARTDRRALWPRLHVLRRRPRHRNPDRAARLGRRSSRMARKADWYYYRKG